MAGKFMFSRNFTSSKALENVGNIASLKSVFHDADIAKWRNLFFFVCCPALVVGSISVYLEDPPERPEFKKYSHLRIRNKPFPWRDGVKTLFHNPHFNALPNGYETEDHH